MECELETEKDFVILVTGMVFEARIAHLFGKNFKAVVSGGSPTQLEKKIRFLIKKGGKGIISYGVAGGLRKNLKPGDIVVGSAVIDKDICIEMDERWTSHLHKKLLGSAFETVLGVDHPVLEVTQKEFLSLQSGAGILDMESHIAAKMAKAYGLPCVVLRVVLDDLHRQIPDAALCALSPDGRINYFGVIRSLCQNPKQIIGLSVLALVTLKAGWCLLRCNRLLGKGFGFFDL